MLATKSGRGPKEPDGCEIWEELHTWAFCYLWATFGHLAVESVGISVWWSDFSILQASCKETQPDNLLAKCLEQLHEAPAIISC